MSDDMISQEEIDALLSGGGGDDAPADDAAASDDASAAGASPTGDTITDMERDALGEIGNISMGGAATTLSVLLGRKVSITTPTVSISNMSQLKEKYPIPFLVVEVGYSIGIEGNNVLCIQAKDAAIIADLMMGNDGTNPDEELSEIHMSAVSESMNQMMGSVALLDVQQEGGYHSARCDACRSRDGGSRFKAARQGGSHRAGIVPHGGRWSHRQ